MKNFYNWCDKNPYLFALYVIVFGFLVCFTITALMPITYTPVPATDVVLSAGPISTMQIITL